MIARPAYVDALKIEAFQTEKVGIYTLRDIREELRKPGRDPRAQFAAPQFQSGVNQISDLTPGMILEGAVTNVTNFGAFVDVGVHQDGLVHISHLADDFVKDPRDVVKTGEMVKVRVLEIDVARQRISLSMKTNIDASEIVVHEKNERPQKSSHKLKPQPVLQNSMSNAFAKALGK